MKLSSLRLSSFICLLSIAAVLIASLGCIDINREPAGSLQNESISVDVGNARSVYASIEMGVGQLRVSGGGDGLMNANFLYNIASWKPEVVYTVAGDSGNLTVRQPSSRAVPEGNATYQWNILLGNEVPINLRVVQGVGECAIDLRGVSITGLVVESGSGNATIDLSGNLQGDVNADIRSGVGSIQLKIPRDIGTRVNIRHGIGDVRVSDELIRQNDGAYVNDRYGKSDNAHTLNVNVESGVGSISLELE